MKRTFSSIFITLLLTGAALAQDPSVSLYLDAAGTQSNGTITIQYNPIQGTYNPVVFTGYIVAFWDTGVVGGAAYQILTFPPVTALAVDYVDGVQLGDPFDGCGVEQGLVFPQSGYFHAPILLGEVTFLMTAPVINASVVVSGHCNYGAVIVADGTGALHEGLGGSLCFNSEVIATESETWGGVKALYR
jgi:hypothetical protein